MLASQGRSAVMASKEEEDEDDDDEEELEDEIEESDPNSMSVADSIALVAADSSCRRPARSKAELQRRRDMGTGGSKGTVAICQEGATRMAAARGRRQQGDGVRQSNGRFESTRCMIVKVVNFISHSQLLAGVPWLATG
jgi:hypothetical protein